MTAAVVPGMLAAVSMGLCKGVAALLGWCSRALQGGAVSWLHHIVKMRRHHEAGGPRNQTPPPPQPFNHPPLPPTVVLAYKRPAPLISRRVMPA